MNIKHAIAGIRVFFDMLMIKSCYYQYHRFDQSLFRMKVRKKTIYDGDSPHPDPFVVASGRDIAGPESQFLSFDGVEIHFVHVSHEDPSRPTVILLHGFSGNVFNFSICPMWNVRKSVFLSFFPLFFLFLQELALSYSLLAFDRPGWGLSARVVRGRRGVWPTESGNNPYSYEFSALLLRHILQERGLWDRPKILFAHSHGGLVRCKRKQNAKQI